MSRRGVLCRQQGRKGRNAGAGVGDDTQIRPMPFENRLGDLAQGVHDGPAVGHLDGAWRGTACRFHVTLSTIAAEERDRWMLLEPGDGSGGTALP